MKSQSSTSNDNEVNRLKGYVFVCCERNHIPEEQTIQKLFLVFFNNKLPVTPCDQHFLNENFEG